MRSVRHSLIPFYALLAFALAHSQPLAFCAENPDPGAGGATIDWPAAGGLSFHDGDTLEFTLRLPPSLIENAPEDELPSVNVWLEEAGAKETVAKAPHAGRALALRSSRPGEWIVHVRGLAPPKEDAALELRVRWNFVKSDGNTASGELRYPGRVAFGSNPIDVVLLMDGSWSMTESDPKRQRVAAVRDFIATARHSAAIGRIAIVQFDSKSTTLIGMTPVSGDFEPAINAISAVGLTDIDGGIRHSLNTIEPARRSGSAIVLFTDGNQEPGEYLNAHLEAQKAGVAIHTMTLGRDADRKLLKRIAEETGGSYADAEKDNDISAAYAAIVSRITRLRTITTTELSSAVKTVRAPVDPTCSALYIATVSEKSGVLKLQLPDGANWTSGEALNPQNFIEKPAHGEWSAQWQQAGAPATVRFAASARTPLYPLFFRASPLPAAPVEFDANDPRLAVSLFDGAEPVANAHVEAHFEYVISVNDEYKTERATVQLFDDGKHGDGAAGDGIYAADMDGLDFLSKKMDFNKGTLGIVLTGTRQGQPFRRELQSPFLLKRSAPPALLATGTYDFGEKFAGETAVADVQLRVRGSGGAFKTELENTPEKMAWRLRLIDPPSALKAKDKRAQRLEIQVPELLSPGEYAGVARFDLAGVESVKVPWRVKVLPVEFKTEPARIDLGDAYPGTTIKAKLRIATQGGSMQLAAAGAPLLKNKPFDAFALDKNGRAIDVEFAIPETAQAALLQHELIFTDTANRERGRVPVSVRILPVKLNVDAKLDFGTVESGDALKREIVLKWEGAAAPILPRVSLAPSALKPALSPLSARDSGWAASLALDVPSETPSGDSSGSLNIEAGPFKTEVRWSAKIIKPAVISDIASLDFGRVYPSRHAERKIVLRADSARPVALELSLAKPFSKPHVAGVALPESALIFSKKIELAPGGSVTVPLALTLPDDAQDGRYDAVLRVASRLGNVDIPLTVTAVNVVDAAAFHVTPTSMVFRLTEGGVLPSETLNIVSHDDEPLSIVLHVPTIPASPQIVETIPGGAPVAPAPPAAPVAFLFNDPQQAQPLTTLNLTVPPRGTLSVTVRPRPDARDAETGSIRIEGGDEHQEVDLRAERFVAPVSAPVQPEPPKLINWIIALIVLLLIVAAVLAKLFIKKSGVRYVCYAAVVHLIIFSLAMPQKAILDALPESIEISLLDAQESLGMSLSDQQARRLDALHSGGGAADDKRAPVLAQAALPAKEGPVELPAPGAGPASPLPGPMNLDAARGVERPVRPADVPEPARGSPNAPLLSDSPLAFDADKPAVKDKPAAAEKLSTEAPRAVQATSIQSAEPVQLPTNFASAIPVSQQRAPAVEAVASAALPHINASVNLERPAEAPPKPVDTVEPARRSVETADAAPLNAPSEAPLAFDALPAAAPQVRPNPKAPAADVARNIPVSAQESGLGAPGLGTLNAPLTPLALSAPGTPGSLGSGAGESRVALAKTSALPAADSSAGLGGGMGGASIGSSVSDTGAGLGFGRIGGGLPSGGEEPLAIGTDGGDGPGKKSPGSASSASGSGKGSGNGNALIGGTQTGNGNNGSGGTGGDGGFGGSARKTAAGGGGLGGNGAGFATGGSGKGTADFGLPNGAGSEWHGRAGGKGGGSSLAPGLSSAQLEAGGGNGMGGTAGGANGNGVAGGGPKNGSPNGQNGLGGAPNGSGFGPGGRVPGGFGMNGDGPGGAGDKPLAIGPVGSGGNKPKGTGIASGGGESNGRGGGGGYGIGRTGAAGGTALNASGGAGGNGLGGLGGAVAGGNGRPGGASDKRLSLARGIGSKELEEGGALRAKAAGVIPGPPHRGINSPYTGGLIRINLGLAKHSGDWNSSPTALQHLRSAFIERSGLPELEVTIPTVEVGDLNAMMKCRAIMMTSNFPVIFKPAEIAALREYIARGGTLWVNDSSASDYEKFDEAFRPQVPLLVPGAELEKLAVDHDFFSSCYDLTKGFKGFRIPPGDKYRQDYMEAAFLPDPAHPAATPGKANETTVADAAKKEADRHRRAGIIYTRNDYSDGLEIDPRMNAGMKSLTDLTNAEMLESSLRFGMNWIAYSMGPQGLRLPPPPETIAEFEKIYRYKGPALPVLDDFTVLTDQWNKPVWNAEKDWCNETILEIHDDKTEKSAVAKVYCKAGEKFKAAITRSGACDLAQVRALVFDLHSSLAQGLNVSLMFHAKDGKAYESRAVFVRPGWNRNLRFPLEMGDMKSSASAVPWQAYDTPFEPRNAIERISVLIYNLNETGTIVVGPIREQK